jgi:23S rRNA (adenine2503-C2)-methyltransferase
MKKNLLNYSKEEITELFENMNEPAYRAEQLFVGIYAKLYNDFSQFSNLSKPLRAELSRQYELRSFHLADKWESPEDNTTKLLWKLKDGLKIESVIIYEGKRVTFCISSQVGCALDCKFCETGKMGHPRNLNLAEIVEQVIRMTELSTSKPTNIVFMGMGEPLLNYDTVMKAADIFADPQGLSFSRKKITISTAGIAPRIYQMADENRPYSLAISINAPTQEIRRKIMPISQKYSLSQLMHAIRYYTNVTDKRVTFEYVMIKGINVSENHAKQLLKLTKNIPSKINAIACNSDDPLYPAPSEEEIAHFEQVLLDGNRTVMIRSRKGSEIQAACGQLFAANEEEGRKVSFSKLD